MRFVLCKLPVCLQYLILNLFLGKHDSARRYLSKATLVDNMFGTAWLAYGHSFAADNEHDQAMAAYFKASQLMKGYILFFQRVFFFFWNLQVIELLFSDVTYHYCISG